MYIFIRSAAMGKRKSRIDRTVEAAAADQKIILPEQTYKRELQPEEYVFRIDIIYLDGPYDPIADLFYEGNEEKK